MKTNQFNFKKHSLLKCVALFLFVVTIFSSCKKEGMDGSKQLSVTVNYLPKGGSTFKTPTGLINLYIMYNDAPIQDPGYALSMYDYSETFDDASILLNDLTPGDYYVYAEYVDTNNVTYRGGEHVQIKTFKASNSLTLKLEN